MNKQIFLKIFRKIIIKLYFFFVDDLIFINIFDDKGCNWSVDVNCTQQYQYSSQPHDA